jgi:hypothetical protein
MNPGQVIHHSKQTTHCLGGGVYLIVRPAWDRKWLVEMRTDTGSRYLATVDSRAEADALATLEVALLPLYTGEVA